MYRAEFIVSEKKIDPIILNFEIAHETPILSEYSRKSHGLEVDQYREFWEFTYSERSN